MQTRVMKKYMLFLLPVALLAGTPGVVTDQYILSGEYTVTICGTSNLRDWKENVGQVTGAVSAAQNEDGSIQLSSIQIKMNVLSIKSDMGRVMEKKTYEALKAAANPNILFTLSDPLKLSRITDLSKAIPVTGYLSLAGVCRPVIMMVKTFEIRQGSLVFEGSQSIRMTDFGVKPPSALFGTMRAAPDITIYFKTNFTKQSFSTNFKN
jgi:polyisoprenoid-binding protein YceI